MALLFAVPVFELAVSRRSSTAGVGSVQHVIVDEYSDVQQLDRRQYPPPSRRDVLGAGGGATKPQCANAGRSRLPPADRSAATSVNNRSDGDTCSSR